MAAVVAGGAILLAAGALSGSGAPAGMRRGAVRSARVADPVAARYPWPFAPSDQARPVANPYHAILLPGLRDEYYHAGIDIRMPAGTPVLAVADGVVRVYRDGAFDNVVLTEGSGDRWEYRHLALDSPPIPTDARVRAGDVVGTVGPWVPGSDYDHIHLNRRRRDGKILDPLDALAPAPPDRIPPEIVGVHLVPDGGDAPFPRDEDGVFLVTGRVDVVVVALDRVDGERWAWPPWAIDLTWRKTGERRRWAPFARALPIPAELPVPRYPRSADALDLSLRTGPLATRNRIPYRSTQRFAAVATNVDARGRPDPSGCWDADAAGPGVHVIEVEVRDRAGLVARSAVRARAVAAAGR